MNGWRARAARSLDRLWYGDTPWRWALAPMSALFRVLVGMRRLLYRTRLRRRVGLDVPVVVVGNITVGGTGKTPFVIWLARELAARGHAPGIITRGYGGRASAWPQRVTGSSSPDDVGDEPVLLAARTLRPVCAGPDRVAAARKLIDETDVDLLLSDDGLQHYRLARSFEIAVIDRVRGLGNRWCLPAGPLREPAGRLRTVGAAVVNGGPASAVAGLERTWPPVTVAMQLEVSRVYRVAGGDDAALADFAGSRIHALAGIGHPERFFEMLERAGLVVLRHPLPDHARIAVRDLPDDGLPVLVTEKDAVKLGGIARSDVWCVAVDAVVADADRERLLAALDAALGVRTPATRRGDAEPRAPLPRV